MGNNVVYEVRYQWNDGDEVYDVTNIFANYDLAKEKFNLLIEDEMQEMFESYWVHLDHCIHKDEDSFLIYEKGEGVMNYTEVLLRKFEVIDK